MKMNNENRIKNALFELFLNIRLIVFDFDGVFTDNAVWIMDDGTEIVRCSRGDGIGLSNISKLGIESLVLSTETNPVVTKRCQKLQIDCIQGCNDKLKELRKIAVRYNMDFQQIAFVGNDINDLDCLLNVGLPIVVNDAHKDVIAHAAYITRHKGGKGAVREICDILVEIYKRYKV